MAGTVVQIKRSSTPAAVPSSLAAGELAINIPDKILYSSDGATVFAMSATTPGFDTDVVFNDGGVSNAVNTFTFTKASSRVTVGNSTVNTQINSTVIVTG